jgi:hypothetical protein
MKKRVKQLLAKVLAFFAIPVLAAVIASFAYRLFAPDPGADMPGWVVFIVGALCGAVGSTPRNAVGRHFLKQEAVLLSKTVTPYYTAPDIFVWRDNGGSLQMMTSAAYSAEHLTIRSAMCKKLKNGNYRVIFICETSRTRTATRAVKMPESDLPLFAELFSCEL